MSVVRSSMASSIAGRYERDGFVFPYPVVSASAASATDNDSKGHHSGQNSGHSRNNINHLRCCSIAGSQRTIQG